MGFEQLVHMNGGNPGSKWFKTGLADEKITTLWS